VRSLHSALVTAAAAAFGVLTWTVAHALTYVLFAHTYDGLDPHSHVGEGPGPITVAMVAFLATLAAVRGRVRPGSMTAACAPAAFVVIEWAEHLAAGDQGPPAALLVIGVVVHATMGAATPLLWNVFVRRAALTLLILAPHRQDSDRKITAQAPAQTWTAAHLPSQITSRGPPILDRFRSQLCET